jgi:hypothetical protein
METINHHAGGAPYYLVEGSEHRFVDLIPAIIKRAQLIIWEEIGSILPNNPVVWVPLEEVWGNLNSLVAEAKARYPDSAVVSLSHLYYPKAEVFLSCNRIVNREGVSLGIGARPGAKEIPGQIADLKSLLPNRPLILVDDMLFHGESLGQLLSFGLDKVVALVICFAAKDGARKVREEMGIDVLVRLELGDLLDMMPLHDFLPPLPLCGKVVGEKHGWSPCASPLEKAGLSVSIPYLLPFIDAERLESWASIPRYYAGDFSAVCLAQAIQIFSCLEKAGCITKVKELATIPFLRASYPLYSWPINPERRITEILEEARDALFFGEEQSVADIA